MCVRNVFSTIVFEREKDILCLSFLGLLFLFTPIKGSWCVSIIIILRMRIGFPGLKIRESFKCSSYTAYCIEMEWCLPERNQASNDQTEQFGLWKTSTRYHIELWVRGISVSFTCFSPHKKINDWRKPGKQIMREIISKKTREEIGLATLIFYNLPKTKLSQNE